MPSAPAAAFGPPPAQADGSPFPPGGGGQGEGSAQRPFFPVVRPVAVLMIVVAVLVFGYFSYNRLPMALMPDISYPTLTVRTAYPGAAPEEVESEVSRPIEEVLSTVGGLIRMTSISRAETSDTILEFGWGENIDSIVQEVREQLDLLPFPDEIERPLILRYDPTLDPVMRIGVYGDVDLYRLRFYAEEEVAPALEAVEGVAVARVRGGLEREIRVALDEGKIAALGLKTDVVIARLRAENVNLAGGRLKEGETEYLIRTLSEFKDVAEIGSVVATERDGAPIRLTDIATMLESHKDREVITRIDGREAVEVAVYREADANLVDVAQRVREKLLGTEAQQMFVKALESGMLGKAKKGEKPFEARRRAMMRKMMTDFVAYETPAGVEMRVLSDQSRFVRSAIDEVELAVLVGGLFAVIVLFLFLRSGYSTWVVGLSIPISVVATFAPMYLFGVTLNVMSLGGLAMGVGMLVDNAIVVLESIQRCREEGDGIIDASVRGAREVISAITASTLTSVAVFFPIVFVEGVAGQIFGNLALTVVFSLLASLGTAVFFVPMMTARQGRLTARERAERPSLGMDIRFRTWTVSIDDFRALKDRGWIARIVYAPYYAVRLPVLLALELVFAKILFFIVLGITLFFRLLLRVLGVVINFVIRIFGIGIRATAESVMRVFRGQPRPDSVGIGGVKRVYVRMLGWSLDHRLAVVGISLALLGYTVYLVPGLGAELIPDVAQGEFTLETSAPIGTPLEETARRAMPLERLLRDMDEVEAVTAVTGIERESSTETDKGEHTADLTVRLADDRVLSSLGLDLTSAEERVVARMRKQVADTPGLDAEVTHPTLFTFRTPLEVEIKGHDLPTLHRFSRSVLDRLEQLPFLVDVRANVRSGHPEVQITYRRDRLAALGLGVADVAREVRNKVQGFVATHFTRGDRRHDVVVRLEEKQRADLEKLESIAVDVRGGVPIPLGGIAEVRVVEGPAEVRRIDGQRAARITADVTKGIDLASAARRVRAELVGLARPREFSLAVTGQDEEMERSLNSLWLALLLAVFLVYVVMASSFESLKQPLVILFSLPLAAVGAVFTLAVFGYPLSVFVLLGMIVLAGIVVNDAIVLVDYINQCRARGMSRRDAILTAGPVRLRPILITTVTTVLGLLPLALGIGEGAELRTPMAICVIAGLTSATLLTLIVVPVVYDLMDGLFTRRVGGDR